MFDAKQLSIIILYYLFMTIESNSSSINIRRLNIVIIL
jgi:hypothetical protein